MEDYTNNEFNSGAWLTEGTSEPDLLPAPVLATPIAVTVGQFVGSAKSDKYHYLSCLWAKKILPENEVAQINPRKRMVHLVAPPTDPPNWRLSRYDSGT